MFSLKKLKPIVVECVTYHPHVYEFGKPKLSGKMLPDWWKKLPKPTGNPFDYEKPVMNMKHCVGMTELYKYGFMVPMWSDFVIQLSGAEEYPTVWNKWQFADNKSSATEHHPEQFNAYYPVQNFQHIKLDMPWYFKCKEAIDFMVLDPVWNRKSQTDYFVPYGIINFGYHHAANVNMFFIRHQKSRTVFLNYNTPLLHIVPTENRPVLIETKLVTESEWLSAYDEAYTTLTSRYKNRLRMRLTNKS